MSFLSPGILFLANGYTFGMAIFGIRTYHATRKSESVSRRLSSKP
jgi:hypothetical protein